METRGTWGGESGGYLNNSGAPMVVWTKVVARETIRDSETCQSTWFSDLIVTDGPAEVKRFIVAMEATWAFNY